MVRDEWVEHEAMNRCGYLCWDAAIIAETDPSDGTRKAQVNAVHEQL
jgi:hypothetical protein